MNKLLVILLLTLPLSAQSMLMLASKASSAAALDCTADTPTDVNYTTFGAGNSKSHTVSGTNTIILLFIDADTSAPSPTVDGVAMTAIGDVASLAGGTERLYAWDYIGATAGTHTVAFTAAGQTRGTIVSCHNAKQSGQPDSFTSTTGVSDGSSEIGLDLTTVAMGTAAIGLFESSVNILNTPSSNGYLVNPQSFGAGFVWGTLVDIPGTGAFSLKAKTASGPGITYNVLGVSIAPL